MGLLVLVALAIIFGEFLVKVLAVFFTVMLIACLYIAWSDHVPDDN